MCSSYYQCVFDWLSKLFAITTSSSKKYFLFFMPIALLIASSLHNYEFYNETLEFFSPLEPNRIESNRIVRGIQIFSSNSVNSKKHRYIEKIRFGSVRFVSIYKESFRVSLYLSYTFVFIFFKNIIFVIYVKRCHKTLIR